eukprot:COSAG05_NODE_1729_length_4192_cov_1.698510_2_plen_145_part_00
MQELLGDAYIDRLRNTRRKQLGRFVMARWGQVETLLRQPLPEGLAAAAAADNSAGRADKSTVKALSKELKARFKAFNAGFVRLDSTGGSGAKPKAAKYSGGAGSGGVVKVAGEAVAVPEKELRFELAVSATCSGHGAPPSPNLH